MSAPIAAVIEASGRTRAVTLADGSGIAPEELVIESRPSVDGRMAITWEHTFDQVMAGATMHLTATQLRVAAAFFHAAAQEAEASA